MNLFCLFSGCILTGTDCPDRLVCNKEAVNSLFAQPVKPLLNLFSYDTECLFIFSLLKRFSHTKKRAQSGSDCAPYLFINISICLSKKVSSFAMSDYYISASTIYQHRG